MKIAYKRSNKTNLYEQVAEKVFHLINNGTLPPGSRIPSVRGLSRQLKVSIATIMEAYRLLEDKGVIEARPQSGYYVRMRLPGTPTEPAITENFDSPVDVSTNRVAMMVLSSSRTPGLIPLGAAIPNPELLPLEKLNRAISSGVRNNAAKSVSYMVSPGYDGLRVQIARRLLESGCTVTPDEVVITSGCQEAIFLALKSICRPGDTVAVETPTYYNFLQVLELLGLRSIEIPTSQRDGISIDALRYAIDQTPIRACLFITNFNNPPGSCMPDGKKKELVGLLAKHEIPLIEDDVYGDLCFSAERPVVAKSYDKKGLVLLCSSFSKTLAPGYRVGWVVPGRFKSELERLKTVVSIASAAPPQLAIAGFLANGGYDRHLRKLRRVYAIQSAKIAQAVGRYFPAGTRVSRPSGGHVLWVELPKHVNSLKLYEMALKAGISIAPGPIFSVKKKYMNFIRLNTAFWSEDIEKAILKLGHYAESLK